MTKEELSRLAEKHPELTYGVLNTMNRKELITEIRRELKDEDKRPS